MAFWPRLLDLALSARRRRHGRDLTCPRAAQLRRLAVLLAGNADTDFGRGHGFAGLLRDAGLDRLRGDAARRRAFAATPADRLEKDWPAAARRALAGGWRRQIPVRDYEGFRPWIDRIAAGAPGQLTAAPVLMFSLTSGGAAAPKLCPVTRAFIREHHEAHLLWMQGLVRDHPEVLRGKFLSIASPAENGRTPGGIPYGAASGRQVAEQSWPVRRRQAAPPAVYGLAPHAAKYHALLVHALAAPLSVAMAVNPSTLALLARVMEDNAASLLDDLARGALRHAPGLAPADAERLARVQRLRPRPARARELAARWRREGRLAPRAVWPELAALATWQGGCAPFYRDAVAGAWGAAPQRCLGLRASEGTFTIPDRDHDAAGVFAVGGHAVEFFPEDADPAGAAPFWADELADGRRYRMVIATGAGLYRYDLGDIVEVRGFARRTPRLAFIRRAGGVASLTGEKVTEDEARAAMEKARARSPQVRLAGFTLLAGPGGDGAAPRYALAVEPERPEYRQPPAAAVDRALLDALARLRDDFDAELRRVNPEYDDRRAGGRLDLPRLRVLAAGAYDGLRAAAAAAGRPDGQWKPPQLLPPPSPGREPSETWTAFAGLPIAAES